MGDDTPNGDDWCAIPCWDGIDNISDDWCNGDNGQGDNCGSPEYPNHNTCSPDGVLTLFHRCQKCSTIKEPPTCNRSGGKEGEGEDCTDPTGYSEEDPTEMPSATPDMPSLPGSDSTSDVAAEETPSTTDRLSLPGSDSGSDAAAEETPSTTGTPSLLGSDSASDAAAEETPSTTATPPLPGSDTPTVDAN